MLADPEARTSNHDPEELNRQFDKLMHTNVLGNIHLLHAFMPQVLQGKIKKVVSLATPGSDLDLVRNYDFDHAPIYTLSKIAMDAVMAEFSAQYKREGVLCMTVSPGVVDVGHQKNRT